MQKLVVALVTSELRAAAVRLLLSARPSRGVAGLEAVGEDQSCGVKPGSDAVTVSIRSW